MGSEMCIRDSPLMSGYACAIPGIMATRTIDNWKERLVTILILPLMSCSARLPIYTLMIGAFIPNKPVFSILNLQGITMVFMYFLGTITAMIIAAIISRFIKERGRSSFVMEMPPYRTPLAITIVRQLFNRGKLLANLVPCLFLFGKQWVMEIAAQKLPNPCRNCQKPDNYWQINRANTSLFSQSESFAGL